MTAGEVILEALGGVDAADLAEPGGHASPIVLLQPLRRIDLAAAWAAGDDDGLFVVAAAAALHRPQHHLEGSPLFVQQGGLVPGADLLADVVRS
jgi:hypothetical protein